MINLVKNVHETQEGLGIRLDLPVMLQTGAFFYAYGYEDVSLNGSIEIDPELAYLSGRDDDGMFGKGWKFVYEKRLVASGEKAYRLEQVDGTSIRFRRGEDGYENDALQPIEVQVEKDGIILHYAEGRRETYDAFGALRSIQDQDSNVLNIVYDSERKLVQVANNSGSYLQFIYDRKGRVITTRDHGGREWHSRYHKSGCLSEIENPEGGVESYVYEEAHAKDASSKLIQILDPEGRTLYAVEYDVENRVTSYRYQSRVYHYRYLAENLVEKVHPNGEKIRYGLSPMGMIMGIVYPDGTHEMVRENAKKRIRYMTDRNGSERTEYYDARHRLVREESDEHIVAFEYEGDHASPSRVMRDGEVVIEARYDDRGHPTMLVYPDGTQEAFRYDSRGNLAAVIDASGDETALEYDERDRVVSLTDTKNQTQIFQYDALDRNTVIMHPDGKSEFFEYTLLDRPLKHGGENNLVYTEAAYNRAQQIAHINNALGASITYHYDAHGMLTKQMHANGTQRLYNYNEEGYVSEILQEDDVHINYVYTDQQLATMKLSKDEASLRIDYDHNLAGELIRARNDHHILKHYYRDGLITLSEQDGIDVDSWFDDSGSLLGIKALSAMVHYHYEGSVVPSVIEHAGKRITQTYDPEDQCTARLYGNGIEEHYAFDAGGYLIQSVSSHREIPNRTYRYDEQNRVIAINDTPYTYDVHGRLIEANGKHYTYDAAGNLLNDEAQYDPRDNRLIENATHTFRHDAAGRTVAKIAKDGSGALRYDYTLLGQLESVKRIDAHGHLLEELSFSYDALGRRVTKKVRTAEDTRIVHYLYHGANIVAILDENKELLASIAHDTDIDAPLSITVYGQESKPLTKKEQAYIEELSEEDRAHLLAQKQTRTYYYHRDHLGSITHLTDESGAIVESFVYDAWGKILHHETSCETYNPYTYTGREFDREDLYCYRARYYDPTIRRFITPDPLGPLSENMNFYAYTDNDPINYRDPLGLKKMCLPRKVVARLKKLFRKLMRKLGTKFFKKAASSVAALFTGLGTIVGVVGMIDSAWTVWKNLGDIKALFNGLSDYDFSQLSAKDIATSLMQGRLPIKVCKKPKSKGKYPNKSHGEKNETCKHDNCLLRGKPVNTVEGIKILSGEEDLDFVLDAPFPLTWQRRYTSSFARKGVLGQGWSLEWEMHLRFSLDDVILIDPTGREVAFAQMEVGQSRLFVTERLELERVTKDVYHLHTDEDATLVFVADASHTHARLTQLHDNAGNRLRYLYPEGAHTPSCIATDDGRLVGLGYGAHDGEKRLERVYEYRYDADAIAPGWQIILSPGGERLACRFDVVENKERLAEVIIDADAIDALLDACEEEIAHIEAQVIDRVGYRYSHEGDLIGVYDGQGDLTRTFAYQNHMMVMHAVPGGLESYYTYTEYAPYGKILRNHTNTGAWWEFAYADGETTVTDHLGRTEIYRYDKDNYLIGRVNALGEETRYHYSTEGLLTRVEEPSGQTKEYYYNTHGDVVLIKEGERGTQIAYDDRWHKPVEISDDLGNTTTLAYDKQGNLISETLADGSTTRYAYNAMGLPIRIVDPLGHESTMRYDRHGRLIRHTDPLGHNTTYAYDNEGQLTAMTDPLGHVTAYAYDSKGNMITITHPDGTQEHFTYNAHRQLIAYTDAKGHTTEYTLDAEGRPTERRNALGGSLRYVYDGAGRLLELHNENRATYRFTYDPLDRLIQEQGLDGILSKYTYDVRGDVIAKEEIAPTGEQISTRFRRNSEGQLIAKEIGDGKQTSTTQYEYDPLGQLTLASNPHARVRLSYDPLGRLISEETQLEGQEETRTLEHSYDPLGRRIHTILPDGRKVRWEYDATGGVKGIYLQEEPLSLYSRDALGQILEQTQGALSSLREYDTMGRLVKQLSLPKEQLPALHKAAKGAAPLPTPRIARAYRYDKSGELIGLEDVRKGVFGYRYDPLGRIIHAKMPSKEERFAFDPAHNLIDQDDKTIPNNRIETYQDKRYTYDAFGNMQTKHIGSHTHMELHYNLEHQLTQVVITKTKLNKSITQTYSYAYDPFGRRISKSDAFGTTYFMWDGNRLLGERRGESEQTYIYEDEGFIPLATIDEANTIRYYHTDHLGTPQELTNTQGQIVWEAEYATWGNTAKVSYKKTLSKIDSQEAVALQPLRFQGQYYDQETGLHYNRFRYYDPDIGRFTSQDPIGLLGGDNLYAYAPNPMAWVDPLGLAATEPVGKAPRGKGSVPKEQRAASRIFSKKQKDDALRLQNHKCPNCGIGITRKTSDGHHIKRHADGGITNQDNLAMLCKDCHKEVHSK